MEVSNDVLIGSDGWFEFSVDAPPEPLDISAFGWLNFAVNILVSSYIVDAFFILTLKSNK